MVSGRRTPLATNRCASSCPASTRPSCCWRVTWRSVVVADSVCTTTVCAGLTSAAPLGGVKATGPWTVAGSDGEPAGRWACRPPPFMTKKTTIAPSSTAHAPAAPHLGSRPAPRCAIRPIPQLPVRHLEPYPGRTSPSDRRAFPASRPSPDPLDETEGGPAAGGGRLESRAADEVHYGVDPLGGQPHGQSE